MSGEARPGWLQKLRKDPSLWPFVIIVVVALLVFLARGATGLSAGHADASPTSASHPSPRPTPPATSPSSRPATGSRTTTPDDDHMARCTLLPDEVEAVVQLIKKGGPFAHPRNDGVTFRNAEGHLPKKPNGYYREYTVDTPGADTRGTRRVVTGGDPATSPPDWYYTGDHYETFCRITNP